MQKSCAAYMPPFWPRGVRNLAKKYPGLLLKKPGFQKGKTLKLDGCHSTAKMADGAENTDSIAACAPADERDFLMPVDSFGDKRADCGLMRSSKKHCLHSVEPRYPHISNVLWKMQIQRLIRLFSLPKRVR